MDLKLVKGTASKSGNHHYILKSGEAIVGSFIWQEWVTGSGYQYMPNMTSRRSTRVLQPTLRAAMMKGARLRARQTDELLAQQHEG